MDRIIINTYHDSCPGPYDVTIYSHDSGSSDDSSSNNNYRDQDFRNRLTCS